MPKLLENLLSLYLVHAARLILPLVLMPVLARRVDADAFSLYLYLTSFIAWCAIFIEYGFNISSTRSISTLDDRREIAKLVSASQSARALLAFASSVTLPLAYYALQPFQNHFNWLVCGWLSAILTGLLPLYYFQGVEKMRPIAVFELLSGLVQLCGIIAFVGTPDHASRIPLIILASRAANLTMAYCLAFSQLGASAFKLKARDGWKTLKKDFQIFLYQALSSLYTSFNIVILGLFVGIKEVAIYAAAEKLVRAGLGFIAQASNAIFPRMSRLQHHDSKAFQRNRKITLWAFFCIGAIAGVVSVILAPYIIPWFYDNKLNDATDILRILSGVIPAIALSNALGFQFLVVSGKENILNRVIFAASACNLVAVALLVGYFKLGASGMAYCWLSIEWMVAISLAIYIFLNRHMLARDWPGTLKAKG